MTVPDQLQTWNSYFRSFLQDATFLHTDSLELQSQGLHFHSRVLKVANDVNPLHPEACPKDSAHDAPVLSASANYVQKNAHIFAFGFAGI